MENLQVDCTVYSLFGTVATDDLTYAMSKLKTRKTQIVSNRVPDETNGPIDNPVEDSPGLKESSFDKLKDKISAQLKNIEKKNTKKGNTLKLVKADTSDRARGKKRNAEGTIVNSQPQSSRTDSHIAKQPNEEYDSEEELRKALKELGGTQEDLDLIAGAGSESELEGVEGEFTAKQDKRKKSKTLQEGISNILKEIALAQGDIEEGHSTSDEDNEGSAVLDTNVQPKQAAEPIPSNPTPRTKLKSRDSRFKCEPRADWFNITPFDSSLARGSEFTPSLQTIEAAHSLAKSLLDAENEVFKNTQQSSSSQAFYNTVIASGTLSDKISALTLAVQESPLHNVKALESLIGLASKRSRAQAIDVLRALKDLFAQGSLLPGDRRLYQFSSQPTLLAGFGQVRSWKQGDRLPTGIDESDLICWAFESWLKQQYFEVLKLLEVWCNDELEFSKGRAVSYIYELLKEKPEQESNLLRLLVNKLGDPIKKIASQASYLLMQILSTHPAMKMVVISAIEADFIFRPGQSMHGIYYAAVTLNQTALSSREEDVAKKLLGIYFGLFTTLLKSPVKEKDDQEEIKSQTRGQRQRQQKKHPVENLQGEELREKLISAVLTGVNRAYPYVGPDQSNFTDHLETLFKITHSANFNTSIQAMLLIQQLTSTHSAASDRFYRTLYESLLDPRLVTASKQQLYLNLLHRSLKADMNLKRTKAFVKRLLQILSLHDPSFICGVFFLLKDLEKTYPSLTALIDQPEDHEDDEEIFHDVDDVEEDAPTRNQTQTFNKQDSVTYDAHKRDPSHANADNTCAWEILPFLAHFHPSVTVSADHFIQHTKLPGKPDLTLHTLIHFLDRFVYRNPKLVSNNLRGSSIMQPTVASDTHAVLIGSASRPTAPAVNTDEFRNKKNNDIAADDVFFHRYFTTLGKDPKNKKRKAAAGAVEDEEDMDDAGEDAVWKAMMDSAPDLEGEATDEDDLDTDMDMSDFADEMDDGTDGDMDEDEGEGSEVDIEPGIFDSDSDLDADLDGGVADLKDTADDSDAESESAFEGLDSDADESSTKRETKSKNREKNDKEKERKKKLKALPTFASAADYAKMLDDDEDEDLG